MGSEVKYNLIYFPVKALAEPIRFLLSYGKLNFEDTRLDPEAWSSMKNGTPFGQVPILEFGDRQAYQSIAICRYLGSIVNLAGNSPLENLEIDSIVDTISEFRSRIAAYNKEDDSESKKSLRVKLQDEVIPFYLNRFNDIAKMGHMALGKLTWADLYFVGILDYCNGVLKVDDLLNNYPNLILLRDSVLHIPSINDWINRRPPSEY